MFSFQAIQERAEEVAQKAIMATLDHKVYIQKNVSTLTDKLNDSILTDLQKLSPNLKYIVSTVILQNADDGEESKSDDLSAAKGIHLGGNLLFF